MENIIVDLEQKHIPALHKFIEKQFHKNYILLNRDFFDWQYKKDGRYNMKIIYHNGEVMGYCGFIPVSMVAAGESIQGTCLANLMVGERARGFGLGAKLIQSISKNFKISYINGYTKESEPIYEKLGGWSPMGDLNRFIKILDNDSSENSKNIEEVAAFNKDFDGFWEKMEKTNKYSGTISRKYDYLKWRYEDHPIFKYRVLVSKTHGEINGFLIFRMEESSGGTEDYKIGRIIDFISRDEAESDLLAAAEIKIKESGARMIDILFSGNFHKESLLKKGFADAYSGKYSEIPLLLNPVSHKRKSINWILYLDESLRGDAKLRDPKNWYITKGDGDQDRPNFL